MVLTEHQEDTLQQACLLLEEEQTIVIKGSAGVGKTTMVKELVNRLNVNKVICSAPTNKAVSVLKDKTDDNNYDFKTIHSTLKLKKFTNYKTGKSTFKPNKKSGEAPLRGIQVLIVDEASMLNKDLITYIEKYSSLYGTKVIYLGDEKQINPVGEDDSPVFHKGYNTLELTEIIRQGAGNPIIDLSRNLSLIKNKEDSKTDIGGYIFSKDGGKVLASLVEANGTDKFKYLAWTNREVDSVNKAVREKIYGNPNKLEVGETITFNTPYSGYFTNQELFINTLDFIERKIYQTVESQEQLGETELLKDTIKCYVINKNSSDPVYIVHEDAEAKYKTIKSRLASSAKNYITDWKGYFDFTEMFADFKYNHAVSIHKSLETGS